MRRRAYLGSLGTIGIVGCLSAIETGNSQSTNAERSDRHPSENWTDTEVATATFDESETPICADGEAVDSTIEGDGEGRTITDHEFFQDDAGRYGVRGLYRGDYIQWVDATFSVESREVTETRHRIYGYDSDETYEFVIVASEGNPSEIDHYQLTLPDGADSGHGPSTEEGLVLLEKGWGIIGESGGETVYGFAATVQNSADERATEIYMQVKSYDDENTLVHTDQDVVTELKPEETHTFYFPYLRCNPGSVTETDVNYFRLNGW